jgi:YVTN family beta-propeller protein
MRRTVLTACTAIVVAAGTVHAQPRFLHGSHASRDGDPRYQVYSPSGEMDVLGTAADPGAFAGDGGATFLPLGTDPEADEHAAAAFLPDGSGVVVANRRSKNLVIYNPTTGAAINSYALSGHPHSLAVSPNGAIAVTANMYEGTASIVDLATGAEVVLPTGIFPSRALITPDGARALIHNSGRETTASPYGKLTVIDLATNTIEREIEPTGFTNTSLSINFEWQGASMASTGPSIYNNSTVVMPVQGGSATVDSQVIIIDIDSGAVTPVAVAGQPRHIEVFGTRAYIIHASNVRKITELDVPTASVVRVINSDVDLGGPAAINAAGDRLAVAVQNNFRVLDLTTEMFTGNLATAASNPNAILRTFDGNHFIAVNFFATLASFAGSVVQNFSGPSNYVLGAVSPATNNAALFSAAFGEDMLLMNTTVGGHGLLYAGQSGPAPEADKPRVVAVNPAGTRAVTANVLSQTASIVDLTTRSVIATLPIQRRPGGVEFTPDGSKAVIASRDGVGVDIIDMATNTVTPVALGASPIRADGVVFSPDGQHAYVNVITGGDGIFRINMNDYTVSPKVLTGDMGSISNNFNMFAGIALSPDGSMLVTCDSFVHTLTFVDTATMSVTATIPVANQPIRAVFSAGGDRLYVSHTSAHTFSIVDTTTSPPSVIGAANVGNSPTEIRLSPDGTRAYVQATQSASPFWPLIAVVDVTGPAPSLVTQWMFAANNPTWVIGGHRLSADGSKLFVARGNASYTLGNGGVIYAENGGFSVIDTASGSAIEEIQTGRMPTFLAKSADDAVLVTTDINAEGVTIFGEAPTVCYANCDGSTTAPVLNVADFTCFLTKFAAGDVYANCDGSTTPPVLNVADFTCFLTKFAAGCP